MNILDEIFLTKKVWNDKNEQVPLYSNISKSESVLLYNIVKQTKPEKSVEIGFAQGISTLAILQAIHDNKIGFHHAIDPYQHEYDYSGLTMVKKAGFSERFNFSEDFPENILPKIGPVDFAFIDASHLFCLSMMDFIFIDRILKVNGIIGFHDLDIKAIHKLITYIIRNRDYNILYKIDSKPIYKSKFKSELFESPRNFLRTIYYELKKPPGFWGIGNMIFLNKISNKGETYRKLKNF